MSGPLEGAGRLKGNLLASYVEEICLTASFCPRGAEILYSLALSHARHAGMDSKYPLSDYAMLTDARRNLGLFQHHDAITGTAKEAVVVDYGVRYVSGISRPKELLPATMYFIAFLSLSLCVSCHRLLHSLMNLKRVIINAAHYLILGDKEAYHYDLAVPFLGAVSRSLCPGEQGWGPDCAAPLGEVGASWALSCFSFPG